MGARLVMLAMLLASADIAQAQYQWTNFAGMPGGPGNVNGTGNAARFDQPWGSVMDASGNLYVADSHNYVIRKVTPTGVVTTFAGEMGVYAFSDGTGTSAHFQSPAGLAMDSSGNLYVADRGNNAIRKITPAGVVTTLAGGSGGTGGSGSADGTGSAAQFFAPDGIAVDGSGNVYVADSGNHTIRQITPAGVVTTFAGSAHQTGSADGTGSAARFNNLSGIVFDGGNNLYVCDTSNSLIRKVTLAGVVTTFAGNAAFHSTLDGTGTSAHFMNPAALARDSSGNLYVTDVNDYVLRKITSSGVVTTLAGSVGNPGSTDGTGSAALFSSLFGVSVDASGNVYGSDYGNGTIRKITPAGVVTTFSGEPEHPGSADGTGNVARFYSPVGCTLDSSGNLFVTDYSNFTIRKITPAGVVTTVAGIAGQEGSVDGTGSAVRFDNPIGIAVDGSGNIFTTDLVDTVRKITPAGVVTTLAGTAGLGGYDNGPGNVALFSAPVGVVVDSSGNLFVTDAGASSVRMITPSNVVSTFAGSPDGTAPLENTDGTGTAATFNGPAFMAIDASNNLYIADTNNCTIRKVTPAAVVTTLAGGPGIAATVDGTGSAARFNYPLGIAVDASGNLYVTEQSCTIRKVTPTGVVTTIGGTAGVVGGADGIGPAAQFSISIGGGIAVTADGSTIYVADDANNRIVKGSIASSTPTISSISSTTANGSYNATTLIPITVTFSAPVTVTGTPTLALNSGGSASFASGSGTATLTFNYTVGATDNATLLDCSSTTALALAGGTINATTGGTAATLTLPTPGGANSLGTNKAIVIDTTPPTIVSINRLTPTGQTTASNIVTFRVTYSEAVTVPGTTNFSVVAVNGSSIVGTVTGVTGTGTTRDVTVTITSGTGEFRLRGVN